MKQRVRDMILAIEEAKALADISHVRKLRDGESCYHIRVGDYRIGVIWDKETVVLVRPLHRKDLYRYFP